MPVRDNHILAIYRLINHVGIPTPILHVYSNLPYRFNADVDVDYQLGLHSAPSAPRTLSTLGLCPLYITAAYHHLPCFRLLLSAGANPDYNYSGPVSREALARSPASCLLDAVLTHGCQPAFVSVLLDHGADPYLVPWEEPEPEVAGRRRVEPEALHVYQEARSEWVQWGLHQVWPEMMPFHHALRPLSLKDYVVKVKVMSQTKISNLSNSNVLRHQRITYSHRVYITY